MVFIRLRRGLFGIADIFLIFKKGIIPTFATVTKVGFYTASARSVWHR
nr:MAG TPA: hypothetical protein [Inoviridae sp.]